MYACTTTSYSYQKTCNPEWEVLLIGCFYVFRRKRFIGIEICDFLQYNALEMYCFAVD